METAADGRTVVGAFVGAILRAAATYGCDVDSILGEAAIPPGALADPGYRLPSPMVGELVALSADASGDPAFGLRLAEQYAAFSYHLHFAMAASSTVRSAVRLLVDHRSIVSHELHLELDDGREVVALRFGCPEPDRQRWVTCDMVAASMVFGLRSLALDPSVAPRHVALRRPTPLDVRPYHDVFRCPVEFGQPKNVLRFDAATMDRPIPTANAMVLKRVEAMITEYVATLGAGPVGNRLRRLLLVDLRNGPPSRDALARRLGLSNRSLARALEREGTSYRDILREVRMTLAAEYLEGGKNSVTEVAFLLGFEDATAFSRAFRTWTQSTPARFGRSRAS